MKNNSSTYHGITLDRDIIKKFCLKNGIEKLSLFGSVLREDFGPESDVDVLVEFVPEARVGFFELFDMEEELSGILGGVKIDIRTPNELSRYFRKNVISEAELQYAR